MRSPSARVEFFFQNSSGLQKPGSVPWDQPEEALFSFVYEETLERWVVTQAVEAWVHAQICDPA